MKKICFALLAVAAGCTTGGSTDTVDPSAPVADTDASTIPATQESRADFVLTPSGYYHKDCVFDVGDDAVIETDGSVTKSDGTRVAVPACTHGHYASLDEIGATAIAQPEAVEPTVNGWVEDLNKWAADWYKKVTATWSVPTSPSHYAKQTVFFFPGFQPGDASTIVQPVLQYGPSAAGGGEYWAISSWDCNKSCPHSSLKRVAVGDVIEGTAAGTSCTKGGACTWTITTTDKTSGASTKLVRKAAKMEWAAVSLEAYGITACDEYPSSGAENFDISVENGNGTTSTAAWAKWSPAHVPHCDYTVGSPDHSHAYLYWNH
ncbi:MAG TPA: hypothetical protein VGG28_35065 [Kofleriaceae bacterium]|jgi:hypothetical protein